MKSLIAMIAFTFFSVIRADELIDSLRQNSLANVNALVILTTQDMLTSGKYTFDNGPDTAGLHVTNFPLYYHFNPLFNRFNLFVNGSAGYSKFDTDIDWSEELGTSITSDDYMAYETVALRLGGGVRYVSSIDIYVLAGFDFIYSRIKNRYDYNSQASKVVLKEKFEEAFANQYSNAYTYELFWQIGYTPVWAEWKPYIILSLNYFDTKQDLSVKQLSSFHSTSGGSRLKVGFETPQFFHLFNTGLSSEFFLAANAFTGDVRETLGFDGYGSSAAMLHFYIDSAFYGEVDEVLYHVPSILNRIDLMVERVNGDGIEGYNIGVGAGFNF